MPKNVWPRKPKPSVLSALEMEKMLELHGNPSAWIVRAALLLDVSSPGWLNRSGTFIPVIPGFKEALQRHLPMVRECLQQTDHRGKVHAIGVLQNAAFAPILLRGSHRRTGGEFRQRGVRDAAEAWISSEPESVLPVPRNIAVEARPAGSVFRHSNSSQRSEDRTFGRFFRIVWVRRNRER